MKFWTEEFDEKVGMSTSYRLESTGHKEAGCPYRGLERRLQALITID